MKPQQKTIKCVKLQDSAMPYNLMQYKHLLQRFNITVFITWYCCPLLFIVTKYNNLPILNKTPYTMFFTNFYTIIAFYKFSATVIPNYIPKN